MMPAAGVAKRIGGLQIAIWLLCRQNDGDPPFEGAFHLLLGGDDLRVALWIDHQRLAHGLYRLVNPGIGEDIAFVLTMRLPAERLGGFDEIIQTAFAGGE